MATSLNGDVYAFGGRDANYVRLTSAYKYSPNYNNWGQLASMPQICFWCSAISMNGRIYIINGSHDNGPADDSSVYDPATNTWSAGGNGLIGTYGHTTVNIGNTIYRIGGITTGGYTNTLEDYGHSLLASLPVALAWAQAVAMPPYIYVAGGSTDNGVIDKTFRYDTVANTWDDNAIADMPEPRAWAASGLVDGKWVIVGGESTENSAISWDPQTNTWSYIAPPLYPRSDTGWATVNGSKLYLVGGLAETDNEVTAQVQEYDPSACITATATATPTLAPSPTICSIQFSDVPVGSTFYAFIRCLACRGIISGYPDGTFRPNNLVTRGQLAKVVSNAAEFNDPQTTQLFEDVPLGSTFQVYVGRLASRGYISGYACGGVGEPCDPPGNLPYFRPNNNATRGQISKIVSNAAGFSEPHTGQTFEDVAPGSTFYDFIERLASRSIMGGYPCGGAGEPCVPPDNRPYFRPNNNATRGQTSKIVSNTFFPACNTPSAQR
jgi:N-acetylneuraminic acid mutarotase